MSYLLGSRKLSLNLHTPRMVWMVMASLTCCEYVRTVGAGAPYSWLLST